MKAESSYVRCHRDQAKEVPLMPIVLDNVRKTSDVQI
jgi:hypothetical protein